MRCLVVGNGYLGKQFAEYFGATLLSRKILCRYDISHALDLERPDFVINCAGKTGRPNIDWCEHNKEETFYSNVVLPSYILQACNIHAAKMVHIGSGCVYQGDNDGYGYSEGVRPNYEDSYYSWTKVVSEKFLSDHDVLQLRLRMPVNNKPDPRNLLTKLLGYKKVVLARNSITYIPDLLFAARSLMNKNASGIFNVVNKGSITHPEILETYRQASGKDISYECISPEELDAITLAPRSNCILSIKKLEDAGVLMRSAQIAIHDCVKEYVESAVESNV